MMAWHDVENVITVWQYKYNNHSETVCCMDSTDRNNEKLIKRCNVWFHLIKGLRQPFPEQPYD